MKKQIRFLSLILASIFVISCIPMNVAALRGGGLNFKDGKFKILVFSDMHETELEDAVWRDEARFIKAAVAKAQPDLIVLDGDNVTFTTQEGQLAGIRKLTAVIAETNIPLALVFGNHDEETGLSEVTQINEYKKYSECLAEVGPTDISGVGNYSLPIYKANGSVGYVLWFIDSNSSANGGYDAVHEDQIEWYEQESAEYKQENGGTAVPAILFQHICVPEIYNALSSSKLPRFNAVKGHGSYSDRYWTLNSDEYKVSGVLKEGPCPPDFNTGEFDSWKKMGDVKLAIFGHDHTNTFAAEVDGITLMQAGGAGFRAYSDGLSQAASLITVNEADASFSRELITYIDVCGEYAESYEFSDYFSKDCWWNMLKGDFVTFLRAFINACRQTLKK